MRAGRPTRGFTLVEMMTVVAIIGILAALATTGIIYGSGKARANNASFEVSSMVSVAQMRAMSTQRPHFFVIWENGTQLGAYVVERDDPTAATFWTTVDPRNQTAVGGRRVVDVPISDRGGVTPFPLSSVASHGITVPLRQPFQAVPVAAVGGSTLRSACTFCVAGGAGGSIGVIRFGPDGRAALRTGDLTRLGASFALGVNQGREAAGPRVIAIALPSASVKVFR